MTHPAVLRNQPGTTTQSSDADAALTSPEHYLETSSELRGPGHYLAAERLLTTVDRARTLTGDAAVEWRRQQLAAAQVHATLALAAATAYPAVRDWTGQDDIATPHRWAEVAS